MNALLSRFLERQVPDIRRGNALLRPGNVWQIIAPYVSTSAQRIRDSMIPRSPMSLELASIERHTLPPWRIVDLRSNITVGAAAIVTWDLANSSIEIAVAPATLTIADDVVEALVQVGFTTLGAIRVEALVDPDSGCEELFDRCGFKREALIRRPTGNAGVTQPVALMARLALGSD